MSDIDAEAQQLYNLDQTSPDHLAFWELDCGNQGRWRAMALKARELNTKEREAPMTTQAHPAYYGGADDPYEAIKVIQAWGLNFALGSVLKYVRRAGEKEGEADLKDLRKARDYIDFEIADREAKADHFPESNLSAHLKTVRETAANAAQALRVGARVRIIAPKPFKGYDGTVTATGRGDFDFVVDLGENSGEHFFFATELEVIG